MAYDVDDIFFIGLNERLRGWIARYEGVEDRDGVFAMRADEEGYGNQQAEGIVGELFLDEPKMGG